MDRSVVYSGAVPLETDLLSAQRFTLLGLGNLAQSVLGTGTLVDGLVVAPTVVPSLAVTVAPGAIYSQQNVDSTAYSSLPADTARQTVKQGLLPDAVTLATPAPTTAGQSVVYLIQAAYQDQDVLPVVLPYYNAANPTVSWSGPANSGTAQNTVRRGACVVSAKAGVASATPSAPAPDVGYVGLYTVTVANGQSTVAAVNIAQLPTAPTISEKLTAKISRATADLYYAPAHGQCRLALSGGNVVLSPCNGNKVFVNGAMRGIPAAGLALPPAGLTAGTVYYIYAAFAASALALESSTTGHVTDPATGVEVKDGDPSRTLVGAAVPVAGPAFAAASGQQRVASYFNRRTIDINTPLFGGTVTATAATELNPAARSSFFAWGDEAIQITVSGVASNNTASTVNYLFASLDGAATQFGRLVSIPSLGAGSAGYGTSPGNGTLPEGLHYITPMAYVSGGTGTYSQVAVNGMIRA